MSKALFYQKMDKKSTKHLIDIVSNQRSKFLPEAIECAIEVLKTRDLSEEELNEVIAKSYAIQDENENAPRKKFGLWRGPGIIVTLAIILPAKLLLIGTGWLETFLIAAVGFGAGHVVNHLYFKFKNKED